MPDDSALLGVARGRVDGDEESDAVLGAAEHLRGLQHHRALRWPQVRGHVAGLGLKIEGYTLYEHITSYHIGLWLGFNHEY